MKRKTSYSAKRGTASFIGPRVPTGWKTNVYGNTYNPNRVYKKRRVLRGVARTMGPQYETDNHYFDTERTQTNITATATGWTGSEYDPNTSAMLCLFAPVIGDDIFNRTGRKAFVKKIRIAGVIKFARGAATTTGEDVARVRVIVYQDKQTNIAQAQGEDVIASGAASNAISMFQNVANLGRFKVLKDKTFLMQNPTLVADAGTTGNIVHSELAVPFKWTIKPNCWVSYNATNGGTVADVVDNSFHLIANAEAATATCNIVYKVRTVFSP